MKFQTSVAYFAKGPLARCRAAFQQSGEGNDPRNPLLEFYRKTILTMKKMDMKYGESLPNAIRNVSLSVSDDEMTPKKKKKKKRKGRKLGRNALYPEEEEEFVGKWWRDDHDGHAAESDGEADMKRRVGDLRLREMQLQILLILETMAIECATGEASRRDGDAGEKTRKKDDLNVLLELYLDRLCIWSAIGFQTSEAVAGQKARTDVIVREFCTEVVVPFYAARLPGKCKLITRRLGVSTTVSSSSSSSNKSKQPKSSDKSTGNSKDLSDRRSQQRPETQTRRPPTLQRVLTDEAASQQRRQSVTRSSAEPGSRYRERGQSQPVENVRGGIQKAKRTENREVDLNAAAREHEVKLKKVQSMADQKKELDAAITALRRPNRELVSRDIADAADQRLSRKPKNPIRNPLGHGVQVMATPKKGSTRNPHDVHVAEEVVGKPLRAIMTPVVTSSARRAKATASDIQETPCRKPSLPTLVRGRGEERNSSIYLTEPVHDDDDDDDDDDDNGNVQETPVATNRSIVQ